MICGKAGRADGNFGAGGVSFTVRVLAANCTIFGGDMDVQGFVFFADDGMFKAGVGVKE